VKKRSLFNLKCLLFSFFIVLTVGNSGYAQQKETTTKFVLNSILETNETENQQVTSSTLEENNLIFNEIETEKELEFSLQDDLAYLNDFVSQKEENQIEEVSKFLNSKKIPLYDLFCSWKFHLA